MTNESSHRRLPYAAPHSFKTLVRVENVTYRIGRLGYGEYEVVRILDDVRLGTFASYPHLTVTSASIPPSFILRIAHAAARGARPSWIERLAVAIRRKSGVRPKVTEASQAEEPEEAPEEPEEPESLQKPRERG